MEKYFDDKGNDLTGLSDKEKGKLIQESGYIVRKEIIENEIAINNLIKQTGVDTNNISDGYHTFGELYEFRKVYNAVLFNLWATIPKFRNSETLSERDKTRCKYDVHKSWKHHDGELAFGGGWFIVSARLPTGLISNHYEAKDWDLFKVPEVEKALFEYDGHTDSNVLERLKQL